MKTFFFGTLYDTVIPGGSSTTSNAHMSLLPIPDTGMSAGASGYSEILQFENGGADVVSAAQTHREYKPDWALREATGDNGIDLVRSYQQRLFGPGLIYFENPAARQTNMFHPAIASPALIEMGWKNIFSVVPAFSNTAANTTHQPRRKATWAWTAATANAVPTLANQIAVLPIHPSYTLWTGFTGSRTGSGAIAIRPIKLDGSYESVDYITTNLQADTSTTRLAGNTYDGSLYKAIEVYITSTATGASSLTLTSAMAQEWPTGYTPTTTGNFIPGEGDTGCKFTSDAIAETYTMIDPSSKTPRHYKGLSADLTEVGAWQKATN